MPIIYFEGITYGEQKHQEKHYSQTVRATYVDLYTNGCTIKPPIVWYIQKCMLIWKICFYSSFVHAICSSKKRRAMLLGPGQPWASYLEYSNC